MIKKIFKDTTKLKFFFSTNGNEQARLCATYRQDNLAIKTQCIENLSISEESIELIIQRDLINRYTPKLNNLLGITSQGLAYKNNWSLICGIY